MSQNAAKRNRSVSPKRALGEAIKNLGPEATHNSLVEFAKKEFGIKFRFMLILPKTAKTGASSRVHAGGNKVRKKAG